MGIPSGKRRASGILAAEEDAKAEVEKMEEPVDIALPEEDATKWRTPGFSRMRMEWSPEDSIVLSKAKSIVDGMVIRNFSDAYEIMFKIYDLVRSPVVNIETGEIEVDQFG